MEYTVILVEHDRFRDTAPAVATAVPGLETLLALPIYLARPDAPGLEAASEVAGVIGMSEIGDRELGLLMGIDHAVLLSLDALAEWRVGGVRQGETYPFIPGEPVGQFAPSAVCAAANFSLTPPDDDVAPTLPADAVNHATRSLARFTVPVMAAGNNHDPLAGFETVSPWAEPDWVLAVGATEDEAGTREAPTSARGTVANPAVGPDILAWGQDALGPGFGTSFAAAKASFLVAIARSWLLQVGANVDRIAGRPFGVPLVGVVVIDRHFADEPFPPPPLVERAQPVIGTRHLTESAAAALQPLISDPTSARMLVQAAAATSPQTDGLSAPAINRDRLIGFLDEVSASELLAILDSNAHHDREATAEDRKPLFGADAADQIAILGAASMAGWQWDVDRRLPRMRHVQEGNE